MGHQISRHLGCLIFKHFEIWYPILICFYLGFQISYRKVVVLQTKLWIPHFQWIMSQLSSMFVTREIKQKLRHIFFWTPFMDLFVKHVIVHSNRKSLPFSRGAFCSQEVNLYKDCQWVSALPSFHPLIQDSSTPFSVPEEHQSTWLSIYPCPGSGQAPII